MYSATIKNLVECITKEYSPTCTVAFLDDLIQEMQSNPAIFIVELNNAKFDYCEEIGLNT